MTAQCMVSFLSVGDEMLIIVCTFITVAMVLFAGLAFAGAAPVTEFLLITGCTGAIAAGFPVVCRCTGIGNSAVMFFLHRLTLLFSFIISLKS